MNDSDSRISNFRPSRLRGLKPSIVFALVVAAVIGQCALAPQTKKRSTVSEVRSFAQRFLDWYTHLTNQDVPDLLEKTVRSKSTWFDTGLRKALLQDIEAQKKVKGEIVGLDFDPFLNTQDPSFSYRATGVKQVGNLFEVEIRSQQIKGGAWTKALTAEVKRSGHSLQFTNFIYSRTSDLKQILKALQRERGSLSRH